MPRATPTSCARWSLHADRRDIQENLAALTTHPHSRRLIASPDRITAVSRRCPSWHPTAVRFPAWTRAACSRSRSCAGGYPAPAHAWTLWMPCLASNPASMRSRAATAVSPRIFAVQTGLGGSRQRTRQAQNLTPSLASNSDTISIRRSGASRSRSPRSRLLPDAPGRGKPLRTGKHACRLSLPTGPTGYRLPAAAGLPIWSGCR